MGLDERINLAWEGLLKKYGAYELERRMSKLPSYRAYVQKWPFDVRGQIYSLDILLEAGYELPEEAESILDQIIADEAVKEFKSHLTPRQRQLTEKLEQGYKPKEFFRQMGYKNTGGLRWHKHVMKKNYQRRQDDEATQ